MKSVPTLVLHCRGGVSLRLGPLAVLTVRRTVIHYRSCRFATLRPPVRLRTIFREGIEPLPYGRYPDLGASIFHAISPCKTDVFL